MNRLNARACAAFPLLLAVAGCNDTGTEFREGLEDQLLAREAVWAANGSASYSIRIRLECECPDGYDVRLEIEDGQIVSGEHVFSGDPLTQAELADHLTVPDLFGLVRAALDGEVPSLSVSYDQDYGFVRFLYIDYDVSRLSDDIQITAEEYVAT